MDAGGFEGEDPDDVGAPLELAVQSFERVVRPDLGPLSGREAGVGEQIGLHLLEPVCDAGCVGEELVDDGPQLGGGGVGVGLDEDRSDQRGDDLAVSVVRGGEQVPPGVHAAALPAGALEAGSDRFDEAGVRVGDDEADTCEPAVDQAAELFPEWFVLTVADVETEDLNRPGSDGGSGYWFPTQAGVPVGEGCCAA